MANANTSVITGKFRRAFGKELVFLPASRYTGMALLLAFCFITSPVFSQTVNIPADLALVGARIYPSPSAAPIENGIVLVRNGEITAVGSPDKILVPKSFRIISCKGMILTAAFWNCHVHLIEPKWDRADTITAGRFNEQMADMLTVMALRMYLTWRSWISGRPCGSGAG